MSAVQPLSDLSAALDRVASFPRLRYMGSKYRLAPALADVFDQIGGATALDAFSGSGVVSYMLKSLGYSVTSNDFLNFPGVITGATVVNSSKRLSARDIETIIGPAIDDRSFISDTFAGLYFTEEDRGFLDSAWSHIDALKGGKRALAISALVLAAARKQPRGVFTFSDLRYDDGRRDLHLPLREHFTETAAAYNATVFDNGQKHVSLTSDIYDIPSDGYDVVYLDPPYAPPKDDNCYIKRYHFLEGLSVYWRGQKIMEGTKTKKLEKLFTPFSYKRTIEDALFRLFDKFRNSTIVLSYSSNAVPDAQTIRDLLLKVGKSVDVIEIDHRYHFGTHSTARRREVTEYIFVAK